MFTPKFDPKATVAAGNMHSSNPSPALDPKSTIALQMQDHTPAKKKSPVLLIVLALVVLGGGTAAFLLLNKKDKTPATAKTKTDSVPVKKKVAHLSDSSSITGSKTDRNPTVKDSKSGGPSDGSVQSPADTYDPDWQSKYESVDALNNGLYKVKLNGKFGLCDSKGKNLGSIQYSLISNFYNGLSVVSLYGRYGYINASGVPAIPCNFQSANDFDNGQAVVKKEDVTFVINTSGQCIQNCPDK